MKADTSNYLAWGQDLVDGACVLSGMTGFEDDWMLLYGNSVVDDFPAKARFTMDPDYPDDVGLVDSLHNIDMLIVGSQALRDVIEAEMAAKVEYLPVPIYNHKKRAVKEPYFIVHPLEPVDCLVIAACKATWDVINPEAIARLKKLVVDESRIPADRLLFRPKAYPNVVLAHRSLAEKIDAAGLTGVRWIELSNYPEL